MVVVLVMVSKPQRKETTHIIVELGSEGERVTHKIVSLRNSIHCGKRKKAVQAVNAWSAVKGPFPTGLKTQPTHLVKLVALPVRAVEDKATLFDVRDGRVGEPC